MSSDGDKVLNGAFASIGAHREQTSRGGDRYAPHFEQNLTIRSTNRSASHSHSEVKPAFASGLFDNNLTGSGGKMVLRTHYSLQLKASWRFDSNCFCSQETVKATGLLILEPRGSMKVSEGPNVAIAAKTLKLKELLAYQEEAVVSRTVIDKEAGTVTIFAFDKGQGLSEHTAPYDALVIVVDGEVEIKISGESFHLREGEMIIMPANLPHALKAMTKFKMVLVMIRSK